MQEYHYLIPEQQQGLEKDIEHIITCEDIEEAEDCFVDAKERLLDVNNWNKYSGIEGIAFRLADSHGRAVARHARKGDNIRVETPGQNGDGHFDWVAIEAIEYDDYPDVSMETFAIRLHPSVNPANKQDDEAYVVADNATSTFVILRRGKKLVATYHGRNEPVNTVSKNTDIAWLGLSDQQCERLMSGIAEPGMVKR